MQHAIATTTIDVHMVQQVLEVNLVRMVPLANLVHMGSLVYLAIIQHGL